MPASPEDREQVVARHLPFVRRTVTRMSAGLPPEVDREELLQAGVVGLLEALDRFDPGRNANFLTFAAFRIRGAVTEELRRNDLVSRGDRQRIREIRRAERKLTGRLGRPPEEPELAAELGLSEAELERVRRSAETRVATFDEIGLPPSEERKAMVDALLTGESADALTWVRVRELAAALARAEEGLPEKERIVLALYYQEDLTLKEIGAVLDLTESRVSQLRTAAIRKLRDRLRRDGMLEESIG
ncbi:MAG: sigma-70 family RNA polymerase sigma factor [Desulfococcaceae bacterium]